MKVERERERERQRREESRSKENEARPNFSTLTFFLSSSPFFSFSPSLLYALGRGPCSRAPSATATREQRAPTARLSSRLDRGGAQQAQASPHHEFRRRRRRRDGSDDDGGGGEQLRHRSPCHRRGPALEAAGGLRPREHAAHGRHDRPDLGIGRARGGDRCVRAKENRRKERLGKRWKRLIVLMPRCFFLPRCSASLLALFSFASASPVELSESSSGGGRALGR